MAFVTAPEILEAFKAVFGRSKDQLQEEAQQEKQIKWYDYGDLPAPGDGEADGETGYVSLKRIPKHEVPTSRKVLMSAVIVVFVGVSLWLGFSNFRATETAYSQREDGAWQLKFFRGPEKQTALFLDTVRAKDSLKKDDDAFDGEPLQGVADFAAANADYLTEIAVGPQVQSIGRWAFANGTKLQKITVDPANQWYCDVDGVLFTKDMKTLVAYPGGKTDPSYTVPEGVEVIGEAAFYTRISTDNNQIAANETLLSEIILPGTLRGIGEMAFGGQAKLAKIDLPDGLQIIGKDAFNSCFALPEKFYIPASVTDIGAWAFYRCAIKKDGKSQGIRDFYLGGAEDAMTLGEHWRHKIDPKMFNTSLAKATFGVSRAEFEQIEKEGARNG
jgi:hypothetical protein